MQVDVFGWTYEIDVSILDAPESDVRRQISEYETGERRTFDLGVDFPEGFRGDVMCAMVEIPYGETRTYGDLAADLDSAPQAVGQGCGANPVPVVVPCHRVVGADSLGGFSSQGGVDAKRSLLEFERGERQAALDSF